MHNGTKLKEAVNEFLRAQEDAARSPATIESQKWSLEGLRKYADLHNWPALRRIKQKHLKEYLGDLRSRPKRNGKHNQSEPTISISHYETQYRRLRRFFNWCVDEGYLKQNPLLGIPKPRVPRKVIRTVSLEELALLYNATDPELCTTPGKTFLAVRNRAVLALLIDTPIRRGELTTMTVKSVDLEEGRILVTGKGNKQRHMPLGETAQQRLADYLKHRASKSPSTGALWLDMRGRPTTTQWLRLMLRALGKKVRIDNVTPHMFRHTYAAYAGRMHVFPKILAIIGGWASKIPDTYFEALGEVDAKNVQRRISPMDGIVKRLTKRLTRGWWHRRKKRRQRRGRRE